MPNSSRIVFVSLFLLYAAFWVWYGGSGDPLSEEEARVYLARMQEIAAASAHSEPRLGQAFSQLSSQDDGNEFYMINLMKFREKAAYPPGYDYDDDVQAAAARYSAAVIPRLIVRGSHPILMAYPQGRFLDFPGADDWDQVAIVRYRSRRDMFEFAIDLGEDEQGVHKWASLEKTHVFPARPVVDFVFVRGFVAVLLATIGFGAHWIIKRRLVRSA